MSRILTVIVMLGALGTLSACETSRGFVRDAQNVGNALVGR